VSLLLLTAVLCAPPAAPAPPATAATETFLLPDKDDWTGADLRVNPDGSLGLASGQVAYSEGTFPVDTSATSTLRGEFKRLAAASDKDRFFFAFVNFDKDMKRIEALHVNAVEGSDTELAAPCTAQDTILRVRSGAAFGNGTFIAFHTQADFQDLPNRNVNRNAPVVESKALSDGTWQVTCKAPIGIAASAGTPIRAHRGGWYQYSGALAEPIPADWKTFQGTIAGCGPGDHRNRWRPGTAHVQLIVFSSGPSKGPLLALRNVRFESTGGKGHSASAGLVAIAGDAVEKNLRLKPLVGGQDLWVRFADGSSRAIRITVFDRSVNQGPEERLVPRAGVEIQPFDVRYTLCPVELLDAKTATQAAIDRWAAGNTIWDMPLVLPLRQMAGGVEFRVNGSYIGTIKKAVRAVSVASNVRLENAAFHSGPLPDRFTPVDIGARCKPGGMAGARLELSDQAVPFFGAQGENLDLGLTARQSALGGARLSLAETPASFIFTVPCEQFPRAWVLCALEDDPGKDPVLNVQLTRYVEGSGYLGRAFEAMANASVALPGNATRVGTVLVGAKRLPLWRAEIPIPIGKIQDLVFTENRGTHARMRFGKYLDLELSGRLISRRGPSGDQRARPDPAWVSSVHVFGVTLERPAAEMEVKTVEPGNIFHNDEVPELRVQVRPRRPGDFSVRWKVRDAEDRPVGSGQRQIDSNAAREMTISLAQKELGWYGIDLTLLDGDRELITHKASLALLGKDTRQAEVADSPYGSWNYGGPHYTPADVQTYGPVLFKAGFRRSAGVDRYSEKELAPWKLAAPQIRTGGLESTDAQLLAGIRASLDRYPSLTNAMIFHEHAVWGYQVAPELIGRKPEPGSQWNDADKRWDYALRLGRLLRHHFPQLRITLGNSLACSELIAEGLRRGFPEEYADYLGLEVVGRTSLPERQWEGALQGGELMLQTARRFGYHRWKLNACYESNYRLDALLGQRRQAEWYVRDLVLSQAWRFRDIFIGIIMDTGNAYAGSFWGGSGLCTRSPFIYPKRAYVGVAVATKLLDQVALSRNIPTGSPTVYALEFKRQDGQYVYPVWTSRGMAELTIETLPADYQILDFYGRPIGRPDSRACLPLTAGTAVTYLLASAPVVRSIRCGKRTYSDDQPADNLKLVNRMDDSSEWTLAETKEPLLEKTRGTALPYRTLGRYAVRQVADPEKGNCVELELVQPNLALPTVFHEYAVLKLKRPVTLAGKPNSLGLWVKGNSGWGQVYWVLEDARGQRRISCGTRIHRADVFDYDGRVSISFDGWNFLSMPVTDKSSIPDLSTGSVDNLWEFGAVNADETLHRGGAALQYPIKLVGVAFAAQSRPLFLTERREHQQIVRFKDLVAFDD